MKKGVKNKYIVIVFSILFIGAGIDKKVSVCFKDTCFRAEVAKTSDEKIKGLMFRKSLAADSGMLFVYEVEELRPFCMKNTYIPLDMLWINKEKKVVYIKENARPAKESNYETICPDKKAMYVLELNAGAVKRLGIKKGDILKF